MPVLSGIRTKFGDLWEIRGQESPHWQNVSPAIHISTTGAMIGWRQRIMKMVPPHYTIRFQYDLNPITPVIYRMKTGLKQSMTRSWITGNKLLIQESQHQQNTTPTNLSHLCEVIPCSSLNEFSLERLKSSEAFSCVSQHLYRLDTTNTKHLQREFRELTKLVEKTPIYRMKFPHSLSDLSDVHKRIINTFCN